MDADSPLSVFESQTVLELRPGDVVLFRSPLRLNKTQRAEAVAMLNDVFPAFESVILEGGDDIAVLRPKPGIIARLLNRLRK